MADDDDLPFDQQRDIIVGLGIFRTHGGTHCAAEHDLFYAGQAAGRSLTDEEIQTLYRHGWSQDPCSGCADEDSRPEDIAPAYPLCDADDGRHLRTCSEWSRNV